MTYTPGPWSFREYALTDEMLAEARSLGLDPIRFINNDGSVPVSAGETRICVVDCQTEFKRGTGHKAECAERDANARLIAAAPELLEALRDALESWNTKAHLSLATRQAMSAAISKAKGRCDED